MKVTLSFKKIMTYVIYDTELMKLVWQHYGTYIREAC